MNRRQFVLTAGLGFGTPWFAGCAKRISATTPGSTPTLRETAGAASLKAHASARGFLYGCAVNVRALTQSADYRQLVIEQAAIVVAENEMKFGPMRPSPTEFRFGPADELVAFAEAQGIKVRGHNLCWHRQLPAWFAGYATKENAREILVTHIQTVMSRYKGRIQSWDVVNEAVFPPDGRSDGLRDSPWMKPSGPRLSRNSLSHGKKVGPFSETDLQRVRHRRE